MVVLGTIWPEYWQTLTRRPEASEADAHPQARELFAGTYLPVAESFEQHIIDALRAAHETDPRLVEAATRAADGELTQYLAGAPALLERYETAPPGAKALMTVAMDLRRLGHGPAIAEDVLEACAPHYLTERQWHSLPDDWFNSAVSDAQRRCHGGHKPLTRIRPRPRTIRANSDALPLGRLP